ncbi:neutral/alkaline non-lysosomal ceramidase N-terminal domain-containing protein [Aneurinibacillus tyrosinisolvens]|uniref:neutral/alkaline non-lysosomal ceramidase N-terminal domain-containing protein n=1 Tax=Aneurinibacillus tyrosinisolvens TaxID=1443435 RepID=UPI00063F80CF|nr:neutral/alkaline non-lysosomal ceramidase N-terminal domain-containing protein [Aneurinibacillus tyrosinisolvens]
MRAGCYRVDITPEIGTPLGGNVRDDNRSRGIHDPLYANFLYLHDGKNGILFIGLDLIGIYRSFTQEIKADISKATGISPRNIVMFATHTHSGPDVMKAFKEEYDRLVEEFIDTLHEKLVNGAVKCIGNTWDAAFAVGKGTEDSLSFNRRIFMKDGQLRMNWEGLDPAEIDHTAGPIDPDLFVLSVRDQNQRIRALLVNFTLHSAILVGKDWLISRDYIHSLTDNLRAQFGEDVIVLFANGAEGNINHINSHDLNQIRGFEEAERIGNKLSNKITEILSKLEYASEVVLGALSETIELPRRIITIEQAQVALKLLEEVNWRIPSLLDGVPEEAYAREILVMSKNQEETLSTELQVLEVGETALVSLPGEFFVEFGLDLKKQSPYSPTMIIGMANDYIGYVPTELAFEEGGYEIKIARTSQLLPCAGEMVVKKAGEMLVKLKGGGCS